MNFSVPGRKGAAEFWHWDSIRCRADKNKMGVTLFTFWCFSSAAMSQISYWMILMRWGTDQNNKCKILWTRLRAGSSRLFGWRSLPAWTLWWRIRNVSIFVLDEFHNDILYELSKRLEVGCLQTQLKRWTMDLLARLFSVRCCFLFILATKLMRNTRIFFDNLCSTCDDSDN